MKPEPLTEAEILAIGKAAAELCKLLRDTDDKTPGQYAQRYAVAIRSVTKQLNF